MTTPAQRLNEIEQNMKILSLKQEIPRKKNKIIKRIALDLFDQLKTASDPEDFFKIVRLLQQVIRL